MPTVAKEEAVAAALMATVRLERGWAAVEGSEGRKATRAVGADAEGSPRAQLEGGSEVAATATAEVAGLVEVGLVAEREAVVKEVAMAEEERAAAPAAVAR